MHGLRRTFSVASLVIAAALTGCGTTTAVAGHDTAERVAACAGVIDCHVVASADVDGDGRADQVGWRQLSKNVVQIRVSTAAGKLLGQRVDVHLWWGGGAWGGAAPVDGRAGAELLIGSEQGAHTPMYTMLTYRAGTLAVEASPSALSQRWQVDAAWGDYMGWSRRFADGHASVTQSIVFRTEDGKSFDGTRVTYVWNVDHWQRTARAAVSYPSEKSAATIAGFNVRGLDRFPGVR